MKERPITKVKKLRLKRESLRRLTARDLSDVVGGDCSYPCSRLWGSACGCGGTG